MSSSSHVVRRALDDVMVRVDAAYGPDGWGYGIVNTLVMFGVMAGGCVAVFVLRWLVFRLLAARCRFTYVKTGHKDATSADVFVPRLTNSGYAFLNVALELAFLLCAVAAIWFGYFSAGFNFLASPYLPLALSLVGTFAFQAPLMNFGTKIWNNSENLYPTGSYIRIPALGPHVHGFIVLYSAFHVVLKRRRGGPGPGADALTELKLTHTDFFNHVVEHDLYTENDKSEWLMLEGNAEMLKNLGPKAIVLNQRSDVCGIRNKDDIAKRAPISLNQKLMAEDSYHKLL